MPNKLIKVLVRLTQIAALTLTGATAAYAYPALCPSGSSGQPSLCSSCHSSGSPSISDYNGGCLGSSSTTTTTSSGSTGSTATSSDTSGSSSSDTTDTSSDTESDTSMDTETDSDSGSHSDRKEHKSHKDRKEHKRHTWLDAVGSSHANEHSRFFHDPHDNRLHRVERD